MQIGSDSHHGDDSSRFRLVTIGDPNVGLYRFKGESGDGLMREKQRHSSRSLRRTAIREQEGTFQKNLPDGEKPARRRPTMVHDRQIRDADDDTRSALVFQRVTGHRDPKIPMARNVGLIVIELSRLPLTS